MRVTDENVFEVMEPYLEGATVLEIGTGDGFRTEALLEYGKEVVGLEPDSERLAEAEERLKGKSVTLRQGTATALPFESNSFDTAVFTLSLHHVPETEIEKALEEARRVVHKEGHIISLEPGSRGSFFDAELLFDACDGDERGAKALAYYRLLSDPSLKERAEQFGKTHFEFANLDDFIDQMQPKRGSSAEIEAFLANRNYRLTAERRVNVFSVSD